MKRRLLKAIVCLTLIFAVVILPTCAMAGSTAYIYKLAYGNVNFRGKNTDGSWYVKKLLKSGTKVLYWGEKSGQMYKVYTTSGDTGYVFKDYLSPYGAIKKNRIGVVKSGGTTAYKLSGSKLKKNGSLKAGTMLLVYAYNSGWAKCKKVSGTTVYVKTSALKKL